MLFVIITLIALTAGFIEGNPCPREWSYNQLDHTCVKGFFRVQKSFDGAKAYCQSQGGDLLKIRDERTNSFVTQITQEANQYYIGVVKNGDQHTYVGESGKLSFAPWAPSEPNNAGGQDNCVTTFRGKWQDMNCGAFLPFLCVKNAARQTLCPLSWVDYTAGNLCYKPFIDTPKSFGDARSYCKSLGGDLFKIRDETTNAFVSQNLDNRHNYWIGVHRNGHSFAYIGESSKMSFAPWAYFQPDNAVGNEDCVHMFIQGQGEWYDRTCTDRLPFVCELP